MKFIKTLPFIFVFFFVLGLSFVSAESATGNITVTVIQDSCANGATNPPDCNNNTVSGTLSASPSPCTIAQGSSTCTTSLTLSITNPVVGAATNITKTGNTEVASGLTPASKPGIVVSYPSTTFYLNHNGATLNGPDGLTVSADCITGSTWDGSKCAANATAVNGGWGPWTGNSNACGVSGIENRYCNNPVPSNGGLLCPLTAGGYGTSESKSFTNAACPPLSCSGGDQPICPSSCPAANPFSGTCPSKQTYDAVNDRCVDKTTFIFKEN